MEPAKIPKLETSPIELVVALGSEGPRLTYSLSLRGIQVDRPLAEAAVDFYRNVHSGKAAQIARCNGIDEQVNCFSGETVQNFLCAAENAEKFGFHEEAAYFRAYVSAYVSKKPKAFIDREGDSRFLSRLREVKDCAKSFSDRYVYGLALCLLEAVPIK
ncbi:hypothetical protein J4207_00460 [Candidatus Woesearchaeota archaeon]|nr:hypothetical protein [Candidatus Woesearchaeota archaeon]